MEISKSEPTASPYSADFLATHSLSQGTIQRAMESLIERDLIEQEGVYRVTDPVMGAWLKNV